MFRRYVWLTLALLMAGLTLLSMPMPRSPSTSHAAMPVEAATATAEDRPNTSLPVSFYRLRFELSTTARAAQVTAQGTEDFLTVRFMGVQGDPDRQGVNMRSLWVGQETEGSSVAITVDYAVTPEALDEPIPYLFEQTAEGSSILRVFNVVGEETELLTEVHHSGGDPLEFPLDLSALQGTLPLQGVLPTVEPSQMLWAYYYPWYTMESWSSSLLQDWPETPYSSDDPAAIRRHIEQAQWAGIDGFISSWWGPGGYTDQNLATLLHIAQEEGFSVMMGFPWGDLEIDEESTLEYLRYAISTYGNHPAFVRVNGRPVIAVFKSYEMPDSTWEDIFAQLRAEGLDAVFLAMFHGEWPRLDSLEVFDGLFSYGILGIISSNEEVPTVLAPTYATTGRAVRHYPLLANSHAPKIWVATVQPGYDERNIPGRIGWVLEREDGALYRSTFDAALNSDPDWIFITTWNEWWEHTHIEPSQNYGDQYLQITREYAEQWRRPASRCVSDVNANGVGDIADIQTTASELPCLTYLPLVVANWRQPWPTPTPTPTPSPTSSPTPTPSQAAIVLADRAGGLELVSAPATLPLTVGHVAYLPVEVQDYHRPITVSAQTLIHTYVNDVTAAQPGDSTPFTVGRLEAPQSELKLQTLRMRAHPITLSFTPVGQVANLSYTYTLTLEPAIQPRTPLFGVHSAPFYDGLPEPFTQVWGPNCGSCPTTEGDPPGSTRDILCARQQDSCHCHPIQKIRDPEADAHTRRAAPAMQRYASQFLRSVGGWGQIQIEPGRYLWDGLDWVFNDLSPQERDYSPLFSGIMSGDFGWMTCPAYTNPDSSVGFYDPDNTYLVEQYGAYVRELTARYAPELHFIETANEPCYGFYLCPCLDPGGPPCDATSGPNQPACEPGHDSEEFAQTYGPFLSTSANVAAQAMAEANPDALLIAGALEKSGEGLTATTRHMIEHGLLDRGNVALMIHQFPLPWPNWLPHPVDCAYFQVPGDPWWLPPGCETAPPFEDYTTPAGRPIHAQDMWQGIDEKIDAGLLLHDAEHLGVLDHFYLFDTELHAGWHDTLGGEPNEATTPAREAMAGLRIGAINAHQRFLGLEFIFAPADPTAYNLMVKHLAGATPVYAWDAPLTDANYAGLVYKLFTREVQVPGTSEVPGTFDEDIIALWSNADGPLELTLTPSAGPTRFKQVTLTSFADAQGSLAITTTELSAPPATIAVQPLREFYFLSVISDRPGFGWLADLEG